MLSNRSQPLGLFVDFVAKVPLLAAANSDSVGLTRTAAGVGKIAAVLDLSWVHGELASHYSLLGRPSIDPVLMIRMLVIGYVFAIRSERALCREVQVNLAYRWFL